MMRGHTSRKLLAVLLACAALALWLPQIPPLFDSGPSNAEVRFPWLDRRETQAREMLEGAHYDVLIAPPIAGPFAPTYQERVAMVHDLTEALRRRGLRLPDADLLLQAVNAYRGHHPEEQTRRLAERWGVPRVVISTMERERDALRMAVTISLEDQGHTARQTARPALDYADTHPADRVFAEQLIPEVAGWFGAETVPKPKPARLDGSQAPSPATMLALTPQSGATGAANLQVLALLSPTGLNAASWWQRSRVAAEQLPSDDPDRAHLLARAELHLNHRPYAIVLLNGMEQPESRVLRQFADGNAKAAEALNHKVTRPLFRFIGELELNDLRQSRSVTAGAQARKEAASKEWPAFGGALELAYADHEWFSPDVYHSLLAELAQQGWLPPALAAATGPARCLKSAPSNDCPVDELEITGALESFDAEIRRRNKDSWRQADTDLRPLPRDYYELLREVGHGILFKRLRTREVNQALPKVLLGELEAIAPNFAGHPTEFAMRMSARSALMSENKGFDPKVFAELEHLAVALIRRFGAETELAAWARAYTRVETAAEWPTDPFSLLGEYNPHGTLLNGTTQRRTDPPDLATYRRWINHQCCSASALVSAYEALRSRGLIDQAEALLAENTGRFVDAPARIQLEIERTFERGDDAAIHAKLTALLSDAPEVWNVRDRLARFELENGRAAVAQKLWLGNPEFHDPTTNPVSLVNQAFHSGKALHEVGEAELAAPLMELAASLDTGAGAEFEAQAWLAARRNDPAVAAAWHQQNFRRYPHMKTATRYLSVRFPLDASEETWTALQRVLSAYPEPLPWRAALVGHRLAGSSFNDLLQWTTDWRGPNETGAPQAGMVRSHFLFMASVIDRAEPEDLAHRAEQIARFAGDPEYGHMLKAYFAYKSGRYDEAAPALARLAEMFSNGAASTGQQINVVLPYYAFVAAKTGAESAAVRAIDDYGKRVWHDLDFHAAQAVLLALKGKTAAAEREILAALLRHPDPTRRVLPDHYLLLDLLDRIRADTHNESLRPLLRRIALTATLDDGQGWAWAYLAKFAANPSEYHDALRKALLLDAASATLATLDPSDRRKAAEANLQSSPFRTATPTRPSHKPATPSNAHGTAAELAALESPR